MKNIIKEYDVVKAVRRIHDVPIGSIGTVLMVYLPDAIHYEVEFMDEKKETIAVVTVSQEDIEVVTSL